ncbi:Precorrin-6Y C(5,15)-methyltransferase [decarboxylating] [Actinokineospora sp. UTMC 2448]|nr:Precorrin-6Y C(5,15)-methyltransferase [decarboxylating] [Actinokineospora sp. UTMC 2448]
MAGSVSDMSRLAEMVKRPWAEITVVEAEGRDFRRAVNVCRARSAVMVRTAPGAGPAELARELVGWHRYLAVLENVGGKTEQLSIVDATEAERKAWRTPNLVLCLSSLETRETHRWIAGEPNGDGRGWALPMTAFATREGHWIPEHVRALALARLAPRPGVLVWDVCAGSGALGVEAGMLGAAVVAVERDAALCVRIVANANAHGVDVRLEDGELPRALRALPKPDAVFLARSTPDLVRACAGAGADRVVVMVSELDHLGMVRTTLAGAGYAVDGCQLSAAGFGDGPDGGTMVRPAESSFLVWGARIDPEAAE